jgi:ketosteroid isomerase-like protein
MSNVKVVQDIYAAFGRGDLPAILDKLADNVDWEYGYRVAPNPIPWLQPQRGKDGVAGFFKSLQDNLEIHGFGVNALAEGPNLVVSLFHIEATIKKTGKRIVEQDEAHIWHFNDAGKVVRFRHCADTYQQAMAYSG